MVSSASHVMTGTVELATGPFLVHIATFAGCHRDVPAGAAFARNRDSCSGTGEWDWKNYTCIAVDKP